MNLKNISQLLIGLFRFFLHPFFKWVYKNEFEGYEALNKAYSKKMIQIFELNMELDKMHNMQKKYVKILNRYPMNFAVKSKNDEPIIISCVVDSYNFCIFVANSLYTSIDSLNAGVLNTTLNSPGFIFLLEDWGISDTKPSDVICIDNLTVMERQRGYARALLDFLVSWARGKGIKYIVGEVVFLDRKDQEWLIPFYQSLDFKFRKIDEYKDAMMKNIDC